MPKVKTTDIFKCSSDGDVSKDCVQIKGRFSSALRDKAALEGKPTTWNLSGTAMLEQPRPYMAISHVWADGTGTGAWQAGTVNRCLYKFFEDIAKHFSCEGIWWDTLCIPREKAARTLAIQKTEQSYEDARITLVHDCFLRYWEWDPRAAYFGILMSPWFSRGWTALELKKSRKIKVVFKGRHGPVIRDLDEEILAKDDEPEGPRKAGSRIIQNLRKDSAAFKLNDLLSILRSRYTSWPKDMAVISALLLGLTPQPRQQETYRKIIERFGMIAPGHLFHYNVTMFRGFGWCPASLFDMPLDSSDPSLVVSANGNVEGVWRVLPADQCAGIEERCWWNDMHPLIKREVQGVLRNKRQCQLLAERTLPVTRALLVRKTATPDLYQYIGALCFRNELSGEEHRWVEKIVTISGRDFENQTALSDQCVDKVEAKSQMQYNNEIISPDVVSESGRLHTAIWRGEYESFLHLVQTSNLSVTDVLGRGPLHLAAERCHPKMVEDLSLNVEMNLQCLNGQTALHSTAWGGSTSVVAKLLQAGVDRGIEDKNGNLALHIAAQVGNLEIVKFLLADDQDVKGHNDLTPLHFATIHGHEEMVKLLEGADLEVGDNKFGWTPLHCAVDYGNCDIVRLLIQRGADVNAVDDLTWWTPLHLAMMNGDTEITRLLFENGAAATADKHGWMPHYFAEANGHTELLMASGRNNNLSSVDNLSWTPLHCRAINNQPGISKLLLHEGAEIYLQPMETDEQLEFAAQQDFKEAIKWIIQNGASEYASDLEYLFFCAAKDGSEALMRVVINEGVDIRTKSYSDWTMLQICSWEGHEATARLLIEAGAEINVTHGDGRTALHLAAQGGHYKIVELLLQAGASRDAKGDAGITPIHLATFMGHEECVLSLIHVNADTGIPGLSPSDEELELRFARGLDDNLDDQLDMDLERDEGLLKGESSRNEDENKDLDKKIRENEDEDSDSDDDLDDKMYQDSYNGSVDKLGEETPLETAIKSGHDTIAKILIGALPSINSSIGRYGTALHMAVQLGIVSIVRFLLEAGANPAAAFRWYHSRREPLHIAAISGNEKISQLLLNAGADIMAKDNDERTPLHNVARKARGRNADIIPFLINAGAQIDARDFYGQTPLHAACSRNKRAVQRLIDAGADIEADDNSGRRPLHYAERAATMRLLVHAGAKSRNLGDTPLFMAARSSPACTKILLDAGADLEAREDGLNQTPLIYAVSTGKSLRCIEILLERGANLKVKDKMENDAFFYAYVSAQKDQLGKEIMALLQNARGHTRHVERPFKDSWVQNGSD